MRDFQAHIPREVLAAALHDVAGVELDVSAPDWDAEAARYVQKVMSVPEQAERLVEVLDERTQAEAAPWPEHPGQLRRASVTRRFDDDLFENLPTGAADDDQVSWTTAIAREKSTTAAAGRWLRASEFTDDYRVRLAAPAVLGFADEKVEFPTQPQRIKRVLEEVRRRLQRRSSVSKPGIAARLRMLWQAPAEWVIASDHWAPNLTVVETTHGRESMTVSSVVSGSYLYVVISTGEASARDRLSLDDEEVSIRKLEEALADHPEAGQKALDKLNFLLSD